MQQPKPPIAAKPKVKPKTNYIFAGKIQFESENSNHENNVGNEVTFAIERTKNRTNLKSCSQSFENLSSKVNGANGSRDEVNEKNEQSSINSVPTNTTGCSKVQEMKSKLFSKQQSQIFKQNQDDLSNVTNINYKKKSSKELEKILGMRNTASNLKNEKSMKRLSKSFDDAECVSLSEVFVENLTNQMQQKLAAEMKQVQSKIGKNIIEHVSVQQRYEEYKNNRKQPNLVTLAVKQITKPRIMDEEIKKTIEAVLGKDIEIIDSQLTRSVQEEEVLLINGLPVKLEGSDAISIRDALKTGQIPSCDLINQILLKAGILRHPVRLETSLSVKSSLTTTEEIRVAEDGLVLEDRLLETKEDNLYESSCLEVWEPILSDSSSVRSANHTMDVDLKSEYVKHHNKRFSNQSSSIRQNSVCTNDSVSTSSRPTSDLSVNINCSDMNLYDNMSYLMHHHGHSTEIALKPAQSLSYDSGHDFSGPSATTIDDEFSVPSRNSGSSVTTQSFRNEKTTDPMSVDEVDFQRFCIKSGVNVTPQNTLPTIFGTVASDQNPKDVSSRRCLPQETSSTTGPCLKNFECDDNTLLYRDGNLLSAPLDALIQHLVPTNEYFPDRSYIFAFLLSSRLFIKPHQLLFKIWDISQHQQNLKSFIQQKLAQKNPQLACFTKYLVQLLEEWIDKFPYDFRDDRLMSQLRDVTHILTQINPILRLEAAQLLQNLLLKLKSLENYEEGIKMLNCDVFDTRNYDEKSSIGLQQQVSVSSSHSHKSNSSNSSSVISMLINQTDISELCSSPLVLAQQLTHIELERLSYIGPEEFVQAFTKEQSPLEASLKKTHNLEIYVAWFNRLSFLVCTDVVKHAKKKQRARVLEYWIETAREAFDIGNFNSLMAIIAGLNMSPISRLKKTWSKIQSNSKFSILEHQMDSSSNFSSYRSTLKAAMWRSAGATNEREKIVIPFFSLLVKDLYFLNEGCCNKLPSGHINFEKFWQLAKQVSEFINWKQVICPFEKNEKIIKHLQTSSILDENTLALASFECEPPENNHEKDHLKILRSEYFK